MALTSATFTCNLQNIEWLGGSNIPNFPSRTDELRLIFEWDGCFEFPFYQFMGCIAKALYDIVGTTNSIICFDIESFSVDHADPSVMVAYPLFEVEGFKRDDGVATRARGIKKYTYKNVRL